MIDRSQLLLPFQPRKLLGAAATSFVICAILPLLAAICLLAGWIAFVAIWLIVVVLAIVGYGGLIGGFLALFGGKGDEAKGVGCLAIIAGAVAIAIFNGIREPWPLAASAVVDACTKAGSYVFLSIFIGENVWFWSWSILALALSAAACLLVVIGLLRCEGMAKYSLMRIGYTCPNCHIQRLPHFRCSKCSALITDLTPSMYGILRARCGNCKELLPTIDFLGRLTLNKVCSRKECSADLNDPALGHIGEFYFAIVGAASSGKTNLMVASVRQLERAFAPDNRLTVAFANASEEAAYRTRIGQFDRGEVLGKTVDIRAFNLTLTRARGQNCRLYLYDAAGEDFAEEDRLVRHVFHRFVDGIIFIVDPFAESDIRRSRTARLDPATVKRINPASQDASEILARLVNSLEATLSIRAGGLFPIPVAVAVTKIDAVDLPVELGEGIEVSGAYMSMRAAAQDASRQSDRVRRFLVDSGLANPVGILESRFPQVAYFGVSALGRLPDPADRSPFRPRGVLAPLVWLCFHVQALSDAPSVQAVTANALRTLDRSLRGLQGTRARVVSWLLLACAGSLVLCGLWYGIILLKG